LIKWQYWYTLRLLENFHQIRNKLNITIDGYFIVD
jgi:hypothetical protein